MRDDYFKKIGVIRPKPTDSSGQPFEPKPMGKKAGGRIGFKKGSGRTGVGAMDVKSKISLAKKKKKNKGDLGMQSVKYGLDKNPNVTAADPKAKFIAANKKNKKKVTV